MSADKTNLKIHYNITDEFGGGSNSGSSGSAGTVTPLQDWSTDCPMENPEASFPNMETPTYDQLHSIMDHQYFDSQAAPVGRDAAMSSPQISESCGAEGAQYQAAAMARAQEAEAAAASQAAGPPSAAEEEGMKLLGRGYESEAGNQKANPGYRQGQEQQAAAAQYVARYCGQEAAVAPPQFNVQVIEQGGSGQANQVPPAQDYVQPAIPRVTDEVRQQQLRPHYPTPYQLGLHQLHCVSLSDLTTRDVARISAEAAEAVIAGKMRNLELGCGPPQDASHPLIAYRKPLEWKVFVSHVAPEEILKAGASVAGVCHLPSSRVQFVRIRHQGEICERLPRVVNPHNMFKNVLPETVTAEYNIKVGVDWPLLNNLPQFRNCRSYAEFHAIASAVEHMLKTKFQIEYLRCYGGNGQGIRLDYRRFKNEHPGVIYLGWPHRGDPDANLIAGWNPYCGLDYGTERLESEYHTLPDIYKDY